MVDPQIVILVVAGSSPVGHPNSLSLRFGHRRFFPQFMAGLEAMPATEISRSAIAGITVTCTGGIDQTRFDPPDLFAQVEVSDGTPRNATPASEGEDPPAHLS